MEPSGLPYDTSEIALRHVGIPEHDWHPAALLRVLQQGCSKALFRNNGRFRTPLEQRIAVSAAAARLGEIGFNLDELVRDTFRSGFAGEFSRVAIRLAYDLSDSTVDVPDALCFFGRDVIDRTRPPAKGETFATYLQSVVRNPEMAAFTHRAAGWLQEAELLEVLRWRLPTEETWATLPEVDPMSTATESRWLADRYLLTFIDHWSTTSLHEEFRWAQGTRLASVGDEYLSLRRVPSERLNAEIARRAVEGDPADPRALLMGAVDLLKSGDHEQAAALFQGALTVAESPWVKNGLAFCLVPSDPATAAVMFQDLFTENFNPPLLHANLAATSRLLGDLEAAREHARTGLALLAGDGPSVTFLWSFEEGDLTLIEIDLRTYLKFVLDWR